ncbi:MAG: DUF2157 domain-containing protein [Planctomycetaceae bacterium]|nr:DUF2157 domain-containing protein [Planctomycetaceae bacterium]
MSKRSISLSQRQWLHDELEWWRDAGIMSAGQSESILEQYESVEEAAASHGSRAVNVLMGAAATLVAAGVLLLISFNWDAMHDAAKLGMIFTTILGTYFAAFRVRQREHVGLSNVLFFLGAFFYGSGIWLVAQIFNLNAHYPDGFWWWALGVLPLAVCLESALLHALLVALLATWCGSEMLGFGEMGFRFWWRWQQIPNGAYMLPVLTAPGMLWAYRRQQPGLLYLYVPLVTWWLSLQSIAWESVWHWSHNPIFFIAAVGGLLLIAAEGHPVGSKLAIPYRALGVLLVGGMLIPLTFKDVHEVNHWWSYRDYNPTLGALLQGVVILVLLVIGIAMIVRLQGRWNSASDLASATKATIKRQWIPVGVTVLMAFFSLWHGLVGEPYLPTLLANAAMFAFAIWLMLVGLREDRGRPFGAGVLYFLLWTVMRYFDLFGDLGGMLGGAMLFFLCGAFLFAMALYWKRRKAAHRIG